MAIAIFSLYFAQYLHSILFFSLFIWRMTGWASLAPQQHSLLSYQPQHSNAVLALNGSCNYLGSALGALLGGDGWIVFIVQLYTFISYSYSYCGFFTKDYVNKVPRVMSRGDTKRGSLLSCNG